MLTPLRKLVASLPGSCVILCDARSVFASCSHRVCPPFPSHSCWLIADALCWQADAASAARAGRRLVFVSWQGFAPLKRQAVDWKVHEEDRAALR